MTSTPAMTTIVAVLLFIAVGLATVRLVLDARGGRLTAGRCTGIVVLQALAALLLHLAMFPPDGTREAGVLTVLARDATPDDARGIVLALPEFTGSGMERTPDLASALRRHPGTTRVIVRGIGLPWRDHDATLGVDLAFEPSPAPAGLVTLAQPRRVMAGQRVLLRGHIAGVDTPSVEVRAAAGGRLARAPAADDGSFTLSLDLRAVGAVDLELRVLDANDALLDTVPVAIDAAGAEPVRALLLAAAPSAELRALRRWAVDAGLDIESRIQLSRDVHLGGRPALEAAELHELDLLLLDERVWRALDALQRDAVLDAARGGLGVLLRIGGLLDEDDRLALQRLGFDAQPIESGGAGVRLHPVHLGGAAESVDSGPGNTGVAPTLSRRPLQVTAGDAAVLLRSDADEPLALWRNEGVGRIALWWLDTTYPLAQRTDPAVHASLWSWVVSTLARARPTADFDPGTDAGLHVRRVLCGLGRGARVQDPAGETTELAVDRQACAGYWPERSGWHVVIDQDYRSGFHVAADDTRPRRAMREATAVLASRPGRADEVATTPTPGSPWPWFLAFLATVSALWWLERRRVAPRPGA